MSLKELWSHTCKSDQPIWTTLEQHHSKYHQIFCPAFFRNCVIIISIYLGIKYNWPLSLCKISKESTCSSTENWFSSLKGKILAL